MKFQRRHRPIGTSTSEQVASSSSPGLRSDAASSSQQPPSTSAQASPRDLFQGLHLHVDTIVDLQHILEYINQAIDKHRKGSNAKLRVPDSVSGNLEDAERGLEQISVLYEKEVGNKDIATAVQLCFRSVLGRLDNFERVMGAFIMVAFAVKLLDQTAESKDDCLDILGVLREFGKHLVELLSIPSRSGLDMTAMYTEAVYLIVEGTIVCISQLDSMYARRFELVDAAKGKFSTLGKNIECWNVRLDEVSSMQEEFRRPMSFNYFSRKRKKNFMHFLDKTPKRKKIYSKFTVSSEGIVHDIVHKMEATFTEQDLDFFYGSHDKKPPAMLLYGEGGIGKTTLGEAVCEMFSTRMSATVIKVEIGENPSSEWICNCQSEIYVSLFGEDRVIENPSQGRYILRVLFKQCNSPILLFIDNVFEREHLEELLPGNLLLPRNSYILVTSRCERVSQALYETRFVHKLWKTYHVRRLEEREARTLLNKLLEGCPLDKERQLNSILDLCGGLPLALEVIGSYLKSQKEKQGAWISTITCLKPSKDAHGCNEDHLGKILKWSYNEMDQCCQNIFLDICCLLRNADWNWVRTLFGSEIHTLKALSLVKKAEMHSFEDACYRLPHRLPFYKAEVAVHDLLVTLGEEESPSTGVRVYSRGGSLPSILQADCNEDECQHVEGLALDGKISVSGKTLDAMHKTLRILRLDWDVEIHGECHKIPSKLQFCSVRQFPYRGLSYLHDLRVLHIYKGPVNFDFECVQLPKSLQILELEGVDSLKRFHAMAFENCRSLHTVRIIWCHKLEELPASMCFCPIRVLILAENVMLKSLPGDLNRLQSLETFYFGGSNLQEFPTGLADLKQLREVFVGGFQGLSESVDFSQLSQLEELLLDYANTEAEQLHHGFGKLLSLQTLRIENWRNLHRLSDDFSQLTVLKALSFKGCVSLTELPQGLEDLPGLSELNYKNCKSLFDMPTTPESYRSIERNMKILKIFKRFFKYYL